MWTNGLINKKSKECPGDGWKEGLTLSQKEINRRKNYKPLNIKKIYCVELNLLFSSIPNIKKYFDINNHHRTCYVHIYRCCEDHKLTWQGYHWKYIEDVDNQEPLSYIDVNSDRVDTVKIKFQKTKMPSDYLTKGTGYDFEKAVELAKQN